FLGYKTGELAAVKGSKAFKEARARLEAHYVRTGEDPIHTAARAAENPAMYGDIISGDNAVDPSAAVKDAPVASAEPYRLRDITPPENVANDNAAIVKRSGDADPGIAADAKSGLSAAFEDAAAENAVYGRGWKTANSETDPNVVRILNEDYAHIADIRKMS